MDSKKNLGTPKKNVGKIKPIFVFASPIISLVSISAMDVYVQSAKCSDKNFAANNELPVDEKYNMMFFNSYARPLQSHHDESTLISCYNVEF